MPNYQVGAARNKVLELVVKWRRHELSVQKLSEGIDKILERFEDDIETNWAEHGGQDD